MSDITRILNAIEQGDVSQGYPAGATTLARFRENQLSRSGQQPKNQPRLFTSRLFIFSEGVSC
jgi:hypothetical protein